MFFEYTDLDQTECQALKCYDSFVATAEELLRNDYCNNVNYNRYLKDQKGKGKKGKGKKGKDNRQRDPEKDWLEAGRIALNSACRTLSMVFRYYFNVCKNVEVPDNKGHDQARCGMGVKCSKYGFAHVGEIAECMGTRFIHRQWTAADVLNVFYYDDHSRSRTFREKTQQEE